MRRADMQMDSADMLLDALCNVFGGLVFIALLVAVMPTEPGDAQRPSTETSAPDIPLALKQDALVSEDGQTGAGCPETNAHLSAHAMPPARADWAESNRVTRLAMEALRKRTDEEQRSRRTLSRKLGALATQKQALKRERQRSPTDWPSATQPRVRRLPLLRPIHGLSPLFLAIRNGELYVLSRVRDGKSDFDVHVAEVAMHRTGNRRYRYEVAPRPGRGQRILEWPVLTGRARGLTQEAPSESFFFYISVDRHSFEHFNWVKKALVAAGYRYDWEINDGPLLLVSGAPMRAM